jgi:hypothetical protein
VFAVNGSRVAGLSGSYVSPVTIEGLASSSLSRSMAKAPPSRPRAHTNSGLSWSFLVVQIYWLIRATITSDLKDIWTRLVSTPLGVTRAFCVTQAIRPSTACSRRIAAISQIAAFRSTGLGMAAAAHFDASSQVAPTDLH